MDSRFLEISHSPGMRRKIMMNATAFIPA
jgi:hypothetical protein